MSVRLPARQGHLPHQWVPFQVTGLLHTYQISHLISRCLFLEALPVARLTLPWTHPLAWYCRSVWSWPWNRHTVLLLCYRREETRLIYWKCYKMPVRNTIDLKHPAQLGCCQEDPRLQVHWPVSHQVYLFLLLLVLHQTWLSKISRWRSIEQLHKCSKI